MADATESVVRFGEEDSLVGILTQPWGGGRAVSAPTVILLNAGTLHRIGPHRLYVKIARRLGAAGFSVLRFDFSGMGDSLPRRDNLPFDTSGPLEARAAMDFLGTQIGAREFILMGLCGGGYIAFRTACRDTRVVAAAMVDWFAYRTFGWYLRCLLGGGGLWERAFGLLTSLTRPQGKIWNNGALPPRAQTEADLRALLRRGVGLFLVYTGAQVSYYNYREQFQDAFHTLPLAGQVEVHFYRDADHTLTLLHHQHRLTDAVHDWVERVARGLAWGPSGFPRARWLVTVPSAGGGRESAGEIPPVTCARIADTLEHFIRRQFSVAEADGRFTRSAPLFELGYIDSIGVVELLAFVGREWGVEIPDQDLLSDAFTTIDGIAGVVHCLSRANPTPSQAQPAPDGPQAEATGGVPAR